MSFIVYAPKNAKVAFISSPYSHTQLWNILGESRSYFTMLAQKETYFSYLCVRFATLSPPLPKEEIIAVGSDVVTRHWFSFQDGGRSGYERQGKIYNIFSFPVVILQKKCLFSHAYSYFAGLFVLFVRNALLGFCLDPSCSVIDHETIRQI